MPRISVIVPVYNVEQYLHRCVDSILNQTFTDFELILVDDGSPDNCPAICDKYAKQDSRVTVLHLKNGGVSVARNVALDVARGEFVAFCDSDDFWDLNLLETALDAMNREKADCVLFGYNVFTDDGCVSMRPFEPGCYELSDDQEKMYYFIKVLFSGKHGWQMCDHLFKMDIINEYYIRCCTTCNNFAEDMGFVCRYILHAKRLVCIPDCLYNYYSRKNSMMHKSEAFVRLNDLNEVSFAVGQDFYDTIKTDGVRKEYPILHYLIVDNQLKKCYTTHEWVRIPGEIAKVHRKRWWKENLRKLFFCYRGLSKYYGSHLAQRTLLFATYLQHGNWKWYGYGSGLYHKWYNKTQR